MIKVMLVEDEPAIRKLLSKIVDLENGFEVVCEAGDFATAVTEFTKYRPEVVFVDIDLNGESGIECAKVMNALEPQVKIIFATAHSEYMANAFEMYAFDYIVKPFDVDRVRRTLSKIRSTSVNAGSPDAPEASSKSEKSEKQTVTADDTGRLLVKGRERMDFIDIDEIVFIERDDSMTSILTVTDIFKTSANLNALEQRLPSGKFMRCHKSYIINTDRITKIEPYGRWTYIVKFKGTDATALITAQKYEELKSRFGM